LDHLYQELQLPHSSLELKDLYNYFMSQLSPEELDDLTRKAEALAQVLAETMKHYTDTHPDASNVVLLSAVKGLLFLLDCQTMDDLLAPRPRMD
jgi:hypothetical protein